MDDDPDIAEFIAHVAESSGYDIRMANSGKEFIGIFEEAEPDLIIMDIVMPDMEGNELIQWLVEKEARTPVMLISGFGSANIEMSMELGKLRGANIINALSKPVSYDTLEASLQAAKEKIK